MTTRDSTSIMGSWGWTNGGGHGAVKKNDIGEIVAVYGDSTWIADVDAVCQATRNRFADRAFHGR